MITDFLINIVYVIASSLVNAMPAMPDMPDWFAKIFDMFQGFNYFLPLTEMIQILMFYFGVVAALYVWRVIRLFLPGG